MRREDDVQRFRRTTRRLTAQFIAGKIGRDTYTSGVRAAAVAAGLMTGRRRGGNRGDRILDALAWSNAALPPGELPAALEPHFLHFEQGAIDFDTLRRRVAELIARASQPPSPTW